MYPRLQRANGATILIKQLDIVMRNNYLVESHFKTKHQVADYAEMLNKSPKLIEFIQKIQRKITFTNHSRSPILEARRLLRYSDKSIKEIAYEIGYEDIQLSAGFFKKAAHLISRKKSTYISGANPAIRSIFILNPSIKRMPLYLG
jgi:AraC-like DNA-binding protein